MPSDSDQMLPRVRTTSRFIWFIAILCTIITVSVIIIGITVFIAYIAIRPKVPLISLTYAHLDIFDYSESSSLFTTKLTIKIKFQNDNANAHAHFSDTAFIVGIRGLELTKLVLVPFDVSKNSSVEYAYQIESSPILLSPDKVVLVDLSLKQDYASFELIGTAMTRWRVGSIASVKFRLHLNCQLHFVLSSRDSVGSYCNSRN
ncbi:hypothetical protein CsSME_00049481 [Camellia sinensis var. sinensis]